MNIDIDPEESEIVMTMTAREAAELRDMLATSDFMAGDEAEGWIDDLGRVLSEIEETA